MGRSLHSTEILCNQRLSLHSTVSCGIDGSPCMQRYSWDQRRSLHSTVSTALRAFSVLRKQRLSLHQTVLLWDRDRLSFRVTSQCGLETRRCGPYPHCTAACCHEHLIQHASHRNGSTVNIINSSSKRSSSEVIGTWS